MLSRCLLAVWIAFSPGFAAAQTRVFNLLDYGAKGDGITPDTRAVQAAVDAAHVAGGGRVLAPAGTYLLGSVYLKSNVELYLAEGATLLGSPYRTDYHKITWHALLLADGQENIAIAGPGAIDGQGAALAADVTRRVLSGEITDPYWGNNRPHERERPQLIEFARCRKVRVTQVLLKNSACWVQTYDRCDGVLLDSLRVESMAFWNNDGIDIVDSRNVVIRNCDINAADDGICLKSHSPTERCENILVENCTVRSSASAFKIGTMSKGGFYNIHVRGLRVYDTYRSAIAVEVVDGGTLENVLVENVEARNTGNAVFIRLGHRWQKAAGVGSLRNVRIRNVEVEVPTGRPDAGYPFEGPEVVEPHNLIPSSVTGLPGHPVRDVTLEDITILFGGGGRCERACVPLDSLDKVPERPADYPEFSMFGELPAWGIYARHVEGLTLKNVRLTCVEPDYRPALVLDDVLKFNRTRTTITPAAGAPKEQIFKRK